MKSKKQPSLLNKNGIRRLQPTRRGSIAQNLVKTRQMIEEAASHDAVISGGINER